jgi:hypothetical protein
VKNFKTKCTPPLANNCVLRIMRRRRYIEAERGRSSGVERNLAKVEVVSSNLIARSNSLIKNSWFPGYRILPGAGMYPNKP